MIVGLQITGILFSLIMVYFALLHYKKGHLNGMEISSWIIIWVLVILIVIFPEVVRLYAMSFAVSRVLDLLIAGAFVVVFIMVASSYVRVSQLEKRIEELVRKLALKEKK
ncbi:DUF2304 domain-containing protein [Candidatus Dojkabacteria bacterium]|nr:DUF2304 domain-containing protein [Candidatus Dojkabacteria bacterium]